jgi:glucose/arabinose dehydrogenase
VILVNHRTQITILALCAVLAAGAAGAYDGLSAGAASPHETTGPQLVVSPGYEARLIAGQFSAPVGAAAGDQGAVYVAESGQAEGTRPRVIKLGPGGRRTTLADDFTAPVTGITWHQGKLYVAYAGGVDVLDPATGVHHPILSKLPAKGDHPNGAVLFGVDGKLYFGIGTATNSGIIGLDNINRGWVATAPAFHDIPCKPVKLRGSNYSVPNPLTPDSHDMSTTGAFSAFGTTTARLQTVPGALPCTGAILRANPDGTGLQLVAWGLRNPGGLAQGADGSLFFTMQGYEERGSRPIVGDKDYLYRVISGQWYGWPDFAGTRSVTGEQFQKPGFPVTPLLAEKPGLPPNPTVTFPHGAGVSGLVFPSPAFGLTGDALVATSEGVSRVDLQTGDITPFVRNQPGEAGLGSPVWLAEGARKTLYLVDQGQFRDGVPIPGTGALWVIERK